MHRLKQNQVHSRTTIMALATDITDLHRLKQKVHSRTDIMVTTAMVPPRMLRLKQRLTQNSMATGMHKLSKVYLAPTLLKAPTVTTTRVLVPQRMLRPRPLLMQNKFHSATEAATAKYTEVPTATLRPRPLLMPSLNMVADTTLRPKPLLRWTRPRRGAEGWDMTLSESSVVQNCTLS
jgi:hypothetical protein